MHKFGLFLLFFIFIFTLVKTTSAQVEKPLNAPKSPLPAKIDSLPPSKPRDTTMIKTDTLKKVKGDTLKSKKKRKGDIETTIFYSAKDSINSSIDRKIVKLYGDAKIKYGQIELEADIIVIDYQLSTITANAGTDSLGNRIGYPIFKNGKETYETRDMVYNFKNKKAKISEVVTKQGDGYLHGEAVYKNEKNELFSIGNGYTTCNLAHPHYRIISLKTKAIPGDKMVSGPFYMEFLDVPVPLGFIFGIFPSQRKSSSGILVPAYGEERNRGFFLRNGGYFFDISDYLKLGITADLYSKGSNAIYINSTYRKKYAYSGTFNFSYTNNITSTDIESPQKEKDFKIVWSHSPQSKGTGRFSASLNAATTGFTMNNYISPTAALTSSSQIGNTTAKLSSNISYSKTFANTPFSMGINLTHNQDLVSKTMALALPDLTFNVNNLYPFKQVKGNMFLQNFSTRITSSATNHITNDLGDIGKNQTDSVAPFNTKNLPLFFKNAARGVKFNIPIQTSVKLLKFFTVTPSVNINELWYFEKLIWGVAPSGTGYIAKDTIRGFNAITSYSGNVGLTTRLYGFKAFKKGRIQAIRHVINPSIGYSAQPDFSAAKYGYFQQFESVSSTGVSQTTLKSHYDGFIYGPPPQGKSGAVSFSINNNIEMKVKSATDTVAKKIPLFNTLSLGSSYNFAATSYKLAPFSLSANTNVLNNKVNVSLSGVIDPYKYHLDSIGKETKTIYQHKTEEYAWSSKLSLGQIESLSFAFSTNLNPKGQSKDNSTRNKIANSNMPDADKQFLIKNPDSYIDFSIPWNLRLNYNASYSHVGYTAVTFTQNVGFSGDISLSEKWKVQYRSGYDFTSKQFTATSISLNRDIHCWQMTLNWVPFGRFQSYNFTIAVKSAMLRDLKLNRTRSFQDAF